jgi:membrane associated rhomboid family serine protease
MTATPVGMRCPECSRQRTRVHTMRNVHAQPVVMYALIAINVLMYFGSTQGGVSATGGGGTAFHDLSLYGPAVADGQLWRLVTGGFLHWGLFHLGFNMYALYWLGMMLEPAIGNVRFALLYFASLLAGSFGALVVTPLAETAGASGAVFGLLGAAIVVARARRINLMSSGLLPILLLNLAITLLPGSNISIGGHIGGLIGGGLAMLAMQTVSERRLPAALAYVAPVLIAGVAVAGAIAVAGSAVTA